jgi:hypothetical protein
MMGPSHKVSLSDGGVPHIGRSISVAVMNLHEGGVYHEGHGSAKSSSTVPTMSQYFSQIEEADEEEDEEGIFF